MTPTNSVLEQVTALRRELKITWDAHAREHEQHEKAHAREHEFTQTAIEVAARAAKENKADANEWRASMTDREARFATRADSEAIKGRLEKIEDTLLVAAERMRVVTEQSVEQRRQSEQRVSRQQWTVGLIVGLLATGGSVAISLIVRLSSS